MGWVGNISKSFVPSPTKINRRTKKKDIYVISTPQRPVPLEHYLYTKNEMYKVVDAGRNFLAQGCEFVDKSLVLVPHFELDTRTQERR